MTAAHNVVSHQLFYIVILCSNQTQSEEWLVDQTQSALLLISFHCFTESFTRKSSGLNRRQTELHISELYCSQEILKRSYHIHFEDHKETHQESIGTLEIWMYIILALQSHKYQNRFLGSEEFVCTIQCTLISGGEEKCDFSQHEPL